MKLNDFYVSALIKITLKIINKDTFSFLFNVWQSGLASGVFAPNVKNEDGRDEDQTHYQNGNWSTLKREK